MPVTGVPDPSLSPGIVAVRSGSPGICGPKIDRRAEASRWIFACPGCLLRGGQCEHRGATPKTASCEWIFSRYFCRHRSAFAPPSNPV